MTPADTGLEANRRLLDQALGMLARLSERRYAERRGGWAPVGAQYRHVLEHYQCFLEGLAAGAIDYDGRRRDPALETSPARAAEATRAVQAALVPLTGADGGRPLRVQLRTAADAPAPEWATSTLARELQFLVSHTVHHFALIRLLLDGELDLGSDFGVAPSTLAHARAQPPCAP